MAAPIGGVRAWRRMKADDLSFVVRLSDQTYPLFREELGVFQEKFDLFPQGCLTLDLAGQLAGYCFAHPWTRDRAPALNAPLGRLPREATTYFIHDIAINESARGLGLATEGIAIQATAAKRHGLHHLSLVSVLRTEAFWQRLGFHPTNNDALQREVRTKYPPGALHMERELAAH